MIPGPRSDCSSGKLAVPAMAAPGIARQRTTASEATAVFMWWGLLEGEGQRLLQKLAHAREELGAVRTVEDAVIANQGERHLIPRDHAAPLVHRGPLLQRAHGKQPGLRRIDDRGDLPDPVHPQVRPRERAARPLGRRDLAV